MTTLHALMDDEHLGVLDGQGRQLRFQGVGPGSSADDGRPAT